MRSARSNPTRSPHRAGSGKLELMRVLTLNLWGQNGAWKERRRVLIDGLRTLRPDLVAFQETTVTEGYDQVSDLLGPGYHLAHQSLGLAKNDPAFRGASIASRWPLREVREIDLHVTARSRQVDFPCITLIADIETPVGDVLFTNHLPSWQLDFELEREQQTVVAATAIEALITERRRHVVVAGDLDAEPSAASIRFWTGRQSLGGLSVCYRDAWASKHPADPGHTFTPDNPQMIGPEWPFGRIDYILVRSESHRGASLDIVACELAFSEPVNGIWASDHFGVVADLEVPR
jgi:endonuclease/exonuclease/phosphatase family metal-dependent hydrolase